MLRLLCLAQPLELQSDNLTFRYSHPNCSETEVRPPPACPARKALHFVYGLGLTTRSLPPFGLDTQVRMILHESRVTSVVVSNNGGAGKRKANARARSVLHHVLQWPIFPDSECHPAKAGDSVWTWQVDVPCSQVKPALRRLEVLMGRVNLLIQMIMR